MAGQLEGSLGSPVACRMVVRLDLSHWRDNFYPIAVRAACIETEKSSNCSPLLYFDKLVGWRDMELTGETGQKDMSFGLCVPW